MLIFLLPRSVYDEKVRTVPISVGNQKQDHLSTIVNDFCSFNIELSMSRKKGKSFN